jgi:hypothetical protein
MDLLDMVKSQKKAAPKKDMIMDEPIKQIKEIKEKPVKKKSQMMERIPAKKKSQTMEMAPVKKKTPRKTIKSKKSIKAIKQKAQSEKDSILILMWGYDGTSKSEQIMKFKPEPLIIDLENKLEKLAKKLGFPLDNIIVASQYNEKYEILGGNTLDTIRDMLNGIREKISSGERIPAIALDGISDLRPYAVEEWLEENPSRKLPNTPGDWRDVNDKVRDICFQLINIGRVEQISIFMTAQVGGEYKNRVRIKDIPDCKPWITYNIDHKFYFYVEDKQFIAYCEKSYLDPFWAVNLTDFSHEDKPSLMNMLQDLKSLEKYKKEYEESQQQRVIERKTDSLNMM